RVSQTTNTTSAGTYTFPNLLVGTYTVTVEKSGFSKYTRTNVQISSNQVTEVNPRLTVGAGATTVEVVAGSEVLRVTDSQLVSAEYGHSAGGQFNITTKSGTNNFHGTAFILNNNRNYNAFDNVEKVAQSCDTNPNCDKTRFDFNTVGGTIGGPIKKEKLFFFAGYQRVFAGFSGTSVVIDAPTAAGLTALKSVAEDAAVTDILNQFPTAPAPSATTPSQTVT